MKEPQERLFLARESYRRRRMMDAARILPVAGILFFALPLLWTAPRTSVGWIYLFTVWLLLILIAFVLSRRLVDPDAPSEPDSAGDEAS